MDLRKRIYGNAKGDRKRIAKEAGITPTYLYMVCTGRRHIDSADLALRISAACGGSIKASELLGLDGGDTPKQSKAD